jgi:hypothetical protein
LARFGTFFGEPLMDTQTFLIYQGGHQYGPYSRSQLQEMWNSGSVNADTFYWTEGMAEWASLANLCAIPAETNPELRHQGIENNAAGRGGPNNKYASSFGRCGGLIGFAAMFALPHAGGPIWGFIVGALLGGGGAALGCAVGSFFDSLGREPASVEQMPGKTGMAVTAFVLGIMGLLAWLLPLVGMPVTITGFVLARKARRSPQRGLAMAAMGLSLVGLLLTSINAYFGMLMALRALVAAHGH